MAASACETRRSAWRGLLLCVGLLWAALARGHALPESQLWIDTRADGLALTLRVPLNRLQYALGQPLADDPDGVLPAQAATLSRYLLQHIGLRSGTQGWVLKAPALQVLGHDASAELQATLRAVAPAGAARGEVTLLFDAVLHEVRTHRAQVYLRQDWDGGQAGGPPQLLGTLEPGRTTLQVPLGPARPGAATRALLQAGMAHIAEGLDHLAFLLMLLLVVPLQAREGRWWPRPGHAAVARRALGLVSAFTLGHGLSLLGVAVGGLALPVTAVEVAVALSVALAAAHAVRPLSLLGGWGEALLAGLFGVVHGTAFSSGLQTGGLEPGPMALALLGFNAGIEAMQALLALALLPPLVALQRWRPAVARHLRLGLAAAGGVLALAWAAARLGWVAPGLDALEAALQAGAAMGVVVLWALAAWGCWRPRPA